MQLRLLLNRCSSYMQLGKIALQAGHEIITYDSIDSTNMEAIRVSCKRDSLNPLWIVSTKQTQGRGRQGRSWSSPPGNFYGSLLLKNPSNMRQASQLGFVAGVALNTALKHIAPSLKNIVLKWPNDALLKGAKLAGILLESSGFNQADKSFFIAIGVGINLAFHPDDTPYPATNLASHGAPVSVSDCVKSLSDAFAQKLALYNEGENFDSIRTEWLKAAHEIGTPIKIRLRSECENESISGSFGGIDEAGSLILNQGSKGQLIHAGDVYFAA